MHNSLSTKKQIALSKSAYPDAMTKDISPHDHKKLLGHVVLSIVFCRNSSLAG